MVDQSLQPVVTIMDADWVPLQDKHTPMPQSGTAVILTTGCKTYTTVFGSPQELRGHLSEGGTHYQLVEGKGAKQ